MSLTMRPQASRIWIACAVSTTSDEVRPKWSQRAAGPDLLGDGGRERDHVVLGGLLDVLDAGDVEGRPWRAARGGLGGTSPASAIASVAASSTSSQVS